MPDDPDALERFSSTGLHNEPSHPRAMTCRCGRPRVTRRIVRLGDGSSYLWLYCKSCDLIPPMQVNRPQPPEATP
jgi:hypothetical protein